MTEEAAPSSHPGTTPPPGPPPSPGPPPPGYGAPGPGDDRSVPPFGTAGFTSRYGLVRPHDGRYLAGVCAAVGRATNTDPVLWRVLLAVLGFFGGIGILIYVAAWLVIPGEGDTASPVESMLGRGRSAMSPVTVIVLSILVAVSFGYIVTDAFRAVLLGATILVGGALLLNRDRRGAAPPEYPVGHPAPFAPATTAPGPLPRHTPVPTGDPTAFPTSGSHPLPPGGAAMPSTGPAHPFGQPAGTAPAWPPRPPARGRPGTPPLPQPGGWSASPGGYPPPPHPPAGHRPSLPGAYGPAAYPSPPPADGPGRPPLPAAVGSGAPSPAGGSGSALPASGGHGPAVPAGGSGSALLAPGGQGPAVPAGGYGPPPPPGGYGPPSSPGGYGPPPPPSGGYGPPPPPSGGYRPPFAPHGPYAGPYPGAPRPAAPPPRRPKRPRERSRLGAATFSLIFLALGVVGVLDLAGAIEVGASAYFAAALTTIGGGLLVGTWFGRARWLIALGLVTAAALGFVTLAESYDRIRGVDGNVTWSPADHRELANRYENSFGDAVLDLRAIDFEGRDTEVTMSINFGEATVVVPPEVDVTVVADVKAGDAVVFGQRSAGVNGRPRETTDLGGDGAGGGTLRLYVHVNAGNLEVTR